MRNEVRKAVDEYVSESEFGEFEHDIFDLVIYLTALEIGFDEESEFNEVEVYYYSIAE